MTPKNRSTSVNERSGVCGIFSRKTQQPLIEQVKFTGHNNRSYKTFFFANEILDSKISEITRKTRFLRNVRGPLTICKGEVYVKALRKYVGEIDLYDQFHQCFMRSFYARRFRKRKKD